MEDDNEILKCARSSLPQTAGLLKVDAEWQSVAKLHLILVLQDWTVGGRIANPFDIHN